MFDYAMLIRLIAERITLKSEAILYVCDNVNVKKKLIYSLKKRNINYKDKSKYIIFTVNDIWNHESLRGLSYRSYVLLH